MSRKSHAAHYKTLSRHYLTPEQVEDAPIPPPDAEKTALYHTAHALVSERHAKSDLITMVYALLMQWDAEKSPVAKSNRGQHWLDVCLDVLDHIENYTVPQYGDYPNDQLTEWTDDEILSSMKRYLGRAGKGQRGSSEEVRDMLKLIHYASVRYARLAAKDQEANND